MPNLPYDPTTALGLTRLLVSDTDVLNVTFSDAELNALLKQRSNVPELAAAQALRSLASDAVRIAVTFKTDSTNTDTTKIAGELRSQADMLEASAQVSGECDAADTVFSIATNAGVTPGTMDVW